MISDGDMVVGFDDEESLQKILFVSSVLVTLFRDVTSNDSTVHPTMVNLAAAVFTDGDHILSLVHSFLVRSALQQLDPVANINFMDDLTILPNAVHIPRRFLKNIQKEVSTFETTKQGIHVVFPTGFWYCHILGISCRGAQCNV